jgi:HK97 family phage prohead protease
MVDHTPDGGGEPRIARIFAPLATRDVEIDAGARVVRGAIASDESLDSHGTIIRAAGWDLDRYRKNPVLLWAHKASGMFVSPEPEDVLGTADVNVVDGRLVANLKFSPEGVNPKADRVFAQMSAGVLRGLSVGFRPREWEYEERGDEEIMVITRQELAEISVVPIPSNPNTLARELRAMCTKPARPGKERSMSDSTSPVLPASIAALLGVDTEDAAVREISKLQLEIDSANKAMAEAMARADGAESALRARIDTETVREVERRIDAGVISKERRESALALARSDLDAFLAMFPHVDAPKRALLERMVEPEPPRPAEMQVSMADSIAAVGRRVEELRKLGMSHEAAHARVMAEIGGGSFMKGSDQ